MWPTSTNRCGSSRSRAEAMCWQIGGRPGRRAGKRRNLVNQFEADLRSVTACNAVHRHHRNMPAAVRSTYATFCRDLCKAADRHHRTRASGSSLHLRRDALVLLCFVALVNTPHERPPQRRISQSHAILSGSVGFPFTLTVSSNFVAQLVLVCRLHFCLS